MNKFKPLSTVALAIMTFVIIPVRLMAESTTEPIDLRCEFRVNPVGIDVAQPRFSWKFKDSEVRGQGQSAYQILLASSEELLKKDKGDRWDSGKVVSDQNIAVRYAGATLASESRYWWKVRVYDNSGQPSAWSGAAMLMTGKMRSDDWRGKWIGPDIVKNAEAVAGNAKT